MITEIAFTGTPVTDMKRARAFYEGILGLKATMESAGGKWVEYDVGASTFGIDSYGEGWKPSPQGTCVAFEVDDLDAEISRLKSKAVPVVYGGDGRAGLPVRDRLRSGRQQDPDPQTKSEVIAAAPRKE